MIAEYDNGAAPSSPTREYIYDDNQALAVISGGATTYFHPDHLSTRLMTYGSGSTSGQIVAQQGSFPFGEQWYSAGPANKWFFTTYNRDQESGLDYALARYYNSRTGTLCSADPLAGSPEDPQSWNRYVYGRDDPINITDPSGKGWLSWLTDIGIGIGIGWLVPEALPSLFAWGGSSSAVFFEGVQIAQTSGSFYAASLGTAAVGGGIGAQTAAVTNLAQAPPKPPQTTPKKPCPSVPARPKGADVDANIRATESQMTEDQTKSKANTWSWWVNQVKTRGQWDYKTQGIAYDDFGNFNYGATGAVLTNSLNILETARSRQGWPLDRGPS